jgi:hypothetical protein
MLTLLFLLCCDPPPSSLPSMQLQEQPVRYDGIYRILRCWRKKGQQGFLMCRWVAGGGAILVDRNTHAKYSGTCIRERQWLLSKPVGVANKVSTAEYRVVPALLMPLCGNMRRQYTAAMSCV